ncbi:MAG: MFS transporter [Chloroflexi bacterium]|nr:MFS transporter [Chloroflexota bacterium]
MNAARWRSLRNPNYRLYVAGNIISGPGGWLQTVAIAWLVLDKTGSPAALGLVTVFQFLPELVGSPLGGVIVDRLPKRPLIVGCILAQTVQTLALWLLTASGQVQLWQIYALGLVFGITTTFLIPAQQSFVARIIGREDLHHAVALNAAVMNCSRVIGPALGGVVIARWGTSWCFLLNAVTFVAPLAAQALMRLGNMPPEQRLGRGNVFGQLAEGVRYATRTPALMFSLGLTAFIGVFGVNWQVTVPLVARFVLHTGAEGFGVYSAAMGVGALIGALGIATRLRPTSQRELEWGTGFAVLLLGMALVPWFGLALVVIAAQGVAITVYGALSSSTVQLEAEEAYRGRVIALRSWLFMGSSPIGGALTGWLASMWSVQAGIAIEAGICLAACAGGYGWLRRRRADFVPPLQVEAIPA